MRVVIATFPAQEGADAYRRSLRHVFGIQGAAISSGTIGARGEPHHDDHLVVSWVPNHLEGVIRDVAGRCGGILHEPCRTAAAPRSIVEAEAASMDRAPDQRISPR